MELETHSGDITPHIFRNIFFEKHPPFLSVATTEHNQYNRHRLCSNLRFERERLVDALR